MAGRAFTLILTLAYPISVFAALTWWHVQGLGLILCLLGVLRALLPGAGNPWPTRAAGALLAGIGAILLTTEAEAAARTYPIMVNLALFLWLHVKTRYRIQMLPAGFVGVGCLAAWIEAGLQPRPTVARVAAAVGVTACLVWFALA